MARLHEAAHEALDMADAVRAELAGQHAGLLRVRRRVHDITGQLALSRVLLRLLERRGRVGGMLVLTLCLLLLAAAAAWKYS
jgi:hypothetical protein